MSHQLCAIHEEPQTCLLGYSLLIKKKGQFLPVRTHNSWSIWNWQQIFKIYVNQI